jgi:hypothetical protein
MKRATFLLLALLLIPILNAQESRGKIVGFLADPSGAAIPNARLLATHLEMGTNYSATSNGTGNYELPFLIPGIYRLEVEAPGFKKYIRERIEVRVGDLIQLNLSLDVGQQTDSVTVSTEAPLLEAASANQSQLIDRKQLDDLPAGGANPMFFAQLVPGIAATADPAHNWLPSATDVASNFSTAGTNTNTSDFSLDGVSSMARSWIGVIPPMETVQEMRVQTTNYDAQNGHGGGASVDIVMKAGTNDLHGSARWEVGPQPWQALDIFTDAAIYNLATGPVTPAKIKQYALVRKYNRYAATAGGPVFLPKLYNGRNKTFWQYSFQGFNRRAPTNATSAVPTAAERTGDFSGLLKIGSQYQIYDPATTMPNGSGQFTRQPFPNNIIPAARIVAATQNYLKFFPAANAPGTVDGLNNYTVTENNSNDFNQHMARVDEILSDRHRIFVRYDQSWLHFWYDDLFPNNVRGRNRYRTEHGAALDDVYTISPTTLLNIKYGLTRYTYGEWPFSQGYDLSSLGISSSLINQLNPQGFNFPSVSIDSFGTIGDTGASQWGTVYHTWAGTLFHRFSKHSLKWGGEVRDMRETSFNLGYDTPSMSFGTTYTKGPVNTSSAAPVGQGMASFLLGIPTGGDIDLNASYAQRSIYAGLFVQDDWKVGPALTVSLGLRWDHDGAPVERDNRTVQGFAYNATNPITAQAEANYAAAPIAQVSPSQFLPVGGLTFAGLNGASRSYYTTSGKNFSPKVGVAYSLNSKTVLRSGYGISYVSVGADLYTPIQTGFNQSTSLISSLDNGQTYIASLANPFPTGPQAPAPVGLSTYLGKSVSFFPSYRPNPYMQRWSFSVQRELPARTLLEVGYIGNRVTRQSVSVSLDPIPRQYLSTSPVRDTTTINFLSAVVANPFYGISQFAGTSLAGATVARSQLLQAYPEFTGVSGTVTNGFSWYHAMTVTVQKRFTRGYMLSANYTWSKSMTATSYLNATDPSLYHSISSNDRPQHLVISGVYELPVGRGKRFASKIPAVADYVIGGWQLQGIYTAQSGAPLSWGNIVFNGDIQNITLSNGQRSIQQWFNTNAGFDRVSADQPSNNIRTFPTMLAGVRAPGIQYITGSLFKDFKVRERFKVQLRTDWEDLTNSPVFNAPNTTPTSSAFGQITSIQDEQRRIFVGLRVMF